MARSGHCAGRDRPPRSDGPLDSERRHPGTPHLQGYAPPPRFGHGTGAARRPVGARCSGHRRRPPHLDQLPAHPQQPRCRRTRRWPPGPDTLPGVGHHRQRGRRLPAGLRSSPRPRRPRPLAPDPARRRPPPSAACSRTRCGACHRSDDLTQATQERRLGDEADLPTGGDPVQSRTSRFTRPRPGRSTADASSGPTQTMGLPLLAVERDAAGGIGVLELAARGSSGGAQGRSWSGCAQVADRDIKG